MTKSEFIASLEEISPPENLPELLYALWLEAKGNWDKAHRIAQNVSSPDGSHVHAYLHRKEGDEGNAMYWYRNAGVSFPEVSLDKEWNLLVDRLLE